jgi:cytochrome c-type biogenesis protein CcmH
MRGIIRERLAAGDSPEQVKAYFVEKYGLWILLSPPRQGFNLLVWVVPFVALGAGLLLVLWLVRRWSRRSAGASPGPAPDATMRARIHREMAEREP